MKAIIWCRAILCVLTAFLYSCVSLGQQISLRYDVRRTERFETIVGGNIAHSGEKMGVWKESAFQPLKELNIVSLRTHDSKSLDWDMIFPNWNADPNNPNSYNFKKADRIMAFMFKNGFVPFLRLGVSVSAVRTKQRSLALNPPDPKKWAVIVNNIVAHYKEGWANGYNYDIKYIEIWNEPDISFWRGDKEAFNELSYQAITLLKSNFKDIRIGLCGIANIQKNERFADGLLKFLSDPNMDGDTRDRVQIDFFSWHVYELGRGLDIFIRFARLSRELLSKHGYDNVQSFCTEWNAALPSPYLNSFSAAIDVVSTLIWSENNNVNALYFYPLIDKWGLFNLNQAITSNTITDLKWSQLSYAFKTYQDLKVETPKKLFQIQSNTHQDVQTLAGVSETGLLVNFLVSSKSQKKEIINLKISNVGMKNATVLIYQQTESGLKRIKSNSLKHSKNGEILFDVVINPRSIYLLKIKDTNI